MWSLLMGGTSSSASASEDEAAVEDWMLQEEEEEQNDDVEVERVHVGEKKEETRLNVAAGKEVVKHRIPSPTREAGDGMEARGTSSSTNKNSGKTSSEFLRLELPSSKMIKLPQTNISLYKLPPITDDQVQLPASTPTSPLVQMTLAQPQRGVTKTHTMGNFRQSSNDKEPRFVPYEPYKAAITPLVSTKKKPNNKKKRQNTHSSPSEEITPSPIVEQNIHEIITDQPQSQTVTSVKLEQDSATTTSTTCNDAIEEMKLEEEKNKVRLAEQQAEIVRLQKALAESEKQFRIQTQVNSEVKKLLVASVGEDIEAQVDFLTQDKARLAADIRQYSNKISRDFEEKEQLCVESDLWKSKFLASSVIVDELARWKGVLLQRNDDYDHYVRLLLHERGVLWGTLIDTYQVLVKLRNAFDPLQAENNIPNSKTPDAASILGLADLSLKTGKELRDRLLGETQLKTANCKPMEKPKPLDSPAEEGLKHLLEHSDYFPLSEYSERATRAVTGAARPHLAKLNDGLDTSKSEFKCCTHCQGKVQVV